MSAAVKLQDVPAPAIAGRTVPSIAVLATPERVAELKTLCPDVQDLSQVLAADVVQRHGGGLMLIEQGLPGWDQLLLMLAVERPSTAVVVVSDQLPAHMVRALMKLEAWDVLAVSASAGDLLDTAARLSDARTETKGGAATSVCWAFRGAVGGARALTALAELRLARW